MNEAMQARLAAAKAAVKPRPVSKPKPSLIPPFNSWKTAPEIKVIGGLVKVGHDELIEWEEKIRAAKAEHARITDLQRSYRSVLFFAHERGIPIRMLAEWCDMSHMNVSVRLARQKVWEREKGKLIKELKEAGVVDVSDDDIDLDEVDRRMRKSWMRLQKRKMKKRRKKKRAAKKAAKEKELSDE